MCLFKFNGLIQQVSIASFIKTIFNHKTMTKDKIVVTNALPYVNGEIHLGSLLGHIYTDIYTRFLKLQGEDVLFICGADMHGTPVEINARKAGKEPEEFAELVSISKQVPVIMGDGLKRIQPNEYDTLNTQRKSIYAAVDIKKGDIITEDMLIIKGPGGGLLPKFMELVIGRCARKDIEADYPITWENI